MPTIQQLIRKPRKPRVVRQKSMHMQACPQKRGVCTRVYTTTPKKPNSAMRKGARVKLTNGNEPFQVATKSGCRDSRGRAAATANGFQNWANQEAEKLLSVKGNDFV